MTREKNRFYAILVDKYRKSSKFAILLDENLFNTAREHNPYMEGASCRSAAYLTFVVDDAIHQRIPELEDYKNHGLDLAIGLTETHISFPPGENLK